MSDWVSMGILIYESMLKKNRKKRRLISGDINIEKDPAEVEVVGFQPKRGDPIFSAVIRGKYYRVEVPVDRPEDLEGESWEVRERPKRVIMVSDDLVSDNFAESLKAMVSRLRGGRSEEQE